MQEQSTASERREPMPTTASWRRSFVIVAVVSIAVIAVAGCGKRGAGSNSKGPDGSSGPTVGLVTDFGGLNDHSFNALSNKGMEEAERKLGAQGTVLESKAASDYEKNLGQLAAAKKQLTIGVGYLMGEAIKSVAAKSPKTDFAIVDYSVNDIGNPKNVRGLVFHEEQAGYLAGYLAGLVEQDSKLKGLNSKKVVSTIGGQKVPAVLKYIAGYQAGVTKACSGCKVLIDYSQDFVDQSKCQDRANAQISQGSDIIFQVAGGCGQGALQAAKTHGMWGIGVDADQAYLGPEVLTSAIKNADLAVYETIKSVKDGTFQGGQDGVYGLAEGGVGLGTIAPAATSYKPKVDAIAEQIKAGKIDIPTMPK